MITTIQDWLKHWTSPSNPDDTPCEVTLGELRKWGQETERLNALALEQERRFYQFTDNLKSLGVGPVLIVQAITKSPQWSREWPTEPGWYWAYGILFEEKSKEVDKLFKGSFMSQPKISPICVWIHEKTNTLRYSVHGVAIRKEDRHNILWTPAILPDTNATLEGLL